MSALAPLHRYAVRHIIGPLRGWRCFLQISNTTRWATSTPRRCQRRPVFSSFASAILIRPRSVGRPEQPDNRIADCLRCHLRGLMVAPQTLLMYIPNDDGTISVLAPSLSPGRRVQRVDEKLGCCNMPSYR